MRDAIDESQTAENISQIQHRCKSSPESREDGGPLSPCDHATSDTIEVRHSPAGEASTGLVDGKGSRESVEDCAVQLIKEEFEDSQTDLWSRDVADGCPLATSADDSRAGPISDNTHEIATMSDMKLFAVAGVQGFPVLYDRGKERTDQLKRKSSDFRCNHDSVRKAANAVGGEYGGARVLQAERHWHVVALG